MSNRVLLVDDEPDILSAYRRHLRKSFDLHTASGGVEALELIESSEVPFAVIVSDQQMPGMNGVEFLRRAQAMTPDTVRMMLTGNADQQTATDAVNHATVFRFLTKPCTPESLAQAIQAGVVQHQLVAAEKQLLEQTLKGSVKVLTEMLALVNPAAFGRASRIETIARGLCEELQLPFGWELEVAAMLSQLGLVTVPEAVLIAGQGDQSLSAADQQMLDTHASVAADLIGKIPRLEPVAALVRAQSAASPRLDGLPENPLAEQILHIAIAFEDRISRGDEAALAVVSLRDSTYGYDDRLPVALDAVASRMPCGKRNADVGDLRVGLVLAEPALSVDGRLLVGKGQRITESMLLLLRNFAKKGTLAEPLFVYDDHAGSSTSDEPAAMTASV